MTATVYLDYNATAPLKPAVAAAMSEALAMPGNPSSVHGPGRAARRAIEQAREQVAAMVAAHPDRVIFTSGGTEANNLALRGGGRSHRLVSAVEHVSVLDPALKFPGRGTVLPVGSDGLVNAAELSRALARIAEPALVSVMAANNETGVVEPVAELASAAHDAGALVHCDAVQAVGKLPVSMADLGVDFLSLSAHKLGGPQGVGALVLGAGVEIEAAQIGGGQEQGRRAGTENVTAIVGFGEACALAADDMARAPEIAALRNSMESRLSNKAPDLRVFGDTATRLPNTSCVTMPCVPSETQVMALDLDGIAVSAGAACSSGKVGPSHVLRAMGIPAEAADCAIRVSLGWATRASDLDRFVECWSALCERARDRRTAA